VFHELGRPLTIETLELEGPRDDEVLVRMEAVGVCGSDLHIVNGTWRRPTPMVLGHEGAGVVVEVGSEVSHLSPGDQVVLSWAPSCGACRACREGRPARCEALRATTSQGTLIDGRTGLSLDGSTVYRMTATGCLAEHITVRGSAALPVQGIALQEAALLGCAALTGVGAVLYAARQDPGATVVVVGAGGVGQFVVQAARIAGASVVVVVDPVEERRACARALGATDDVSPEDVHAVLQTVVPGGADVVYNAVGSPETTALSVDLTRAGGKTVVVGMAATGERLDLDPFDFTYREKTLVGTIYGSLDPEQALPELVGLVRTGALDLASLVGPTYPLERVNDAFEAARLGAAGRVLVMPGERGRAG
jgi:S-(hydroxymethyl)glutathione dehydrogenase/alcohol dehydrogenase